MAGCRDGAELQKLLGLMEGCIPLQWPGEGCGGPTSAECIDYGCVVGCNPRQLSEAQRNILPHDPLPLSLHTLTSPSYAPVDGLQPFRGHGAAPRQRK